jgi:hypothetical protein
MKNAIGLLVLVLVLSGCSEQSAENDLTRSRVAACQQVMKAYIKEAKIYERDHDRLIASCGISQKERTLEQWQCALAGMEKGGKYTEVSDACGKANATGAR